MSSALWAVQGQLHGGTGTLASLGLPRKIALVHLKIKGSLKWKGKSCNQGTEPGVAAHWQGVPLAVRHQPYFSQISISQHINIANFNCNGLVVCFIFNLQIILLS